MRNLYFRLAVFAIFLSAFHHADGQNEVDAYRYSSYGTAGTARSLACGGAFSAVGADFSSAWLNPAGLALYRKSELEFSPSLGFISNDVRYVGVRAADRSTNIGMTNLGYVYASPVSGDKKEGFKSFSFAAGYNQVANFWRNTSVSAYNPTNSITQFFADRAAGYTQSDLQNDQGYPGLAYASGLLLPDTNGSTSVWLPAVPGGNVRQDLQIIEKGRINEWSLSVAGNVNDFFYIGGGIGIQDLRYSQEMYLQETDSKNLHQHNTADSTDFASLDFFDYYRTRGAGINARLGVIIRPVDFLRIAVSAQSPTWLNLTDTYYSDLTAKYDGDPNSYGLSKDQIGEGRFTYNLTTPFKVTTGIMLMIKKQGFLSADLDFTDYSTASFASDNSPMSGNFVSFAAQNAVIRQYFNFAYNLRLGGEVRFSMFRFRAGFANMGPILKESALQTADFISGQPITLNGNRRLFSGGFGIRQDNYYLDLAIVRSVSEDRRIFYSLDNSSAAEPELVNTKKSTSAILTIGFTF